MCKKSIPLLLIPSLLGVTNHPEQFSTYPGIADLVPRDAIVVHLMKRLSSTHWILAGVFGGLLISVLLSVGVVFVVLRTLRKNASSFSMKTYAENGLLRSKARVLRTLEP